MNKLYKKNLVVVVSLFLFFWGTYFTFLFVSNRVIIEETNSSTGGGFLNDDYGDNTSLYLIDDQIEADEIYIALSDDPEGNSFDEMIGNSLKDYLVEGFFSTSKSGFLKSVLTAKDLNVSLELKGKQDGNREQKSFKIRLYDKYGLWNDQSVINLHKFNSDQLRVRTKLSYDYLEVIPNIVSRRTRFVNLYIKSNTGEFIDYGLYTFVEQPNKSFLRSHNLDFNGHFYEMEDFNFEIEKKQLTESIKDDYSLKTFDDSIESKGKKDHAKLINMFMDVNDTELNINEVIDEHFDEDNLLTWMAVNMLFDNYKKIDEDYYLYSPLNSNKWFFIPGDFEDAWNNNDERASWQRGASILWENLLFRRFLQGEGNVNKLNEKVEELLLVINEENTKKYLNEYENIVFESITKSPDLKHLPITVDEYMRQYAELPKRADINSHYYYETIEKPMPFKLNNAEKKNDGFIFSWEASFDLQGEQVKYSFQLSSDLLFENILVNEDDIDVTEYSVDSLDDGKYYWKVEAIDSSGNKQIASNVYRDIFGDKYFGQNDVIIYEQDVVTQE